MAEARPIVSIVDDDSEVRSSLSSLLRSAALKVVSFASAESFLAAPERAETGCIVTDLHMPGMDGLALQRELKRARSTVPLIMMTAYPTPDARKIALEYGALAFLDKPVDPDLLLSEIDRALASGNEDSPPSDGKERS